MVSTCEVGGTVDEIFNTGGSVTLVIVTTGDTDGTGSVVVTAVGPVANDVCSEGISGDRVVNQEPTQSTLLFRPSQALAPMF